MESKLVVHVGTALSPSPVQELIEQARVYVSRAKADSTVRAYRTDWQVFLTWCAEQGREALPASGETVALYVTDLASSGLKIATMNRRLVAISQAHRAANLESPTASASVRSIMKGIRRVHGTAQVGKAPAITSEIRRMVDMLGDNLIGVRDRALLLLGFAGAFRRSELVSLDVTDIRFTSEGAVVTLRRSKTDQEAQGRTIGIPYGSQPATCPIRQLQAWLDASGVTDGPIFRPINRHGQLQPSRLSDKAVALIVKRSAQAAGLEPARYGGHSLRAGMATSAAANGASERAIMAQTGHKSVTVVRRYIREGSLFRENAATSLGL
jgi:site-specific recombinase XerD